MQDWQQRVVDEKAELDAKLKKLDDFMRGEGAEKFEALADEDQILLLQQDTAMAVYSDVLGERIARFGEV